MLDSSKPNSAETVAISAIGLMTDEFGHALNPRGERFTSTDLQASIRETGVVEPLLCWRQGDQLWLLNGHRRLKAAEAVGLTHVPVVVVDRVSSQAEALIHMLATDVHDDFPTLVLDADGSVIGGKALAVARLLQTPDETTGELPTREAVGQLIGTNYNVVTALERMLTAPVEVRRKIASGDLSVSAFSRMKYAPEDVQREIVDSAEDAVSVTHVREKLREAKQAKASPAPLPNEDLLAKLNQCYQLLSSIEPAELSPRESMAYERIERLFMEES